MDMGSISKLLKVLGIPVYQGFPATRAKVPYMVVRPLTLDPTAASVGGSEIVWDSRFSVYCVTGSVVTSYDLAVDALNTLSGAYVDGNSLSASFGYIGAPSEGSYETQVTVQCLKGSLL